MSIKGIVPITYTEGHKEAMENGASYFECSVKLENRQKFLKMIFDAKGGILCQKMSALLGI